MSTSQLPTQLSDNDLVAAVKRHAQGTRDSTVALIVHLAEMDSRRLHLAAGFGSLFKYCREELRLSEHAAYHVMKAIRPARRFPVILDKLLDGSLNVSTVRIIAPLLTRQNYQELLAEASAKTKREVEEIRARLAPKPDVPTTIRKLPEPRPAVSRPPATKSAPEVPLFDAAPAAPQPEREDPSTISPLSPGRWRVAFTADEEMHDLILMAQDMLSHSVPKGDAKEVFCRALKALGRELARERFADTPRPRVSAGPAAGARGVSAKVQREVWVRDGARCRFIGPDGRRCTERRFIQFDHSGKPYALGGEATAKDIELRCAAHNRYQWETYFGRDSRGYVSGLPQLAPGPVPLAAPQARPIN